MASSSKKDDEANGDETSLIGNIFKRLNIAEDVEENPQILESVDYEGIVNYIATGSCSKIVTVAGAGISTSAGIPDFRSPKSGIYENLAKYDLPDPQAIFEIDYFKENPKPFYELAKELFPGNFKPTTCHYFIKLLHDKGLLLRHYTQNIDTLERIAGIPEDKIIEAHGTFHTSHCVNCRESYSFEWLKNEIMTDNIPLCSKCDDVVKPDIVFFGENLPEKFFKNIDEDLSSCDLLIIMGTTLMVQPFASSVHRVSKKCPRLLINREKVGDRCSYISKLLGVDALKFDDPDNYRDVALLGDCDEMCEKLASSLGWEVSIQNQQLEEILLGLPS